MVFHTDSSNSKISKNGPIKILLASLNVTLDDRRIPGAKKLGKANSPNILDSSVAVYN
jgi:hypothetical protein